MGRMNYHKIQLDTDEKSIAVSGLLTKSLLENCPLLHLKICLLLLFPDLNKLADSYINCSISPVIIFIALLLFLLGSWFAEDTCQQSSVTSITTHYMMDLKFSQEEKPT